MKNLFILLFCFSTQFLIGQTQFGVKGGLNLSDFVVQKDEIENSNLKVGATIGAFARIPIIPWLHLQPEVLFTTKGSKYQFGETTVNASTNYIDIPVVATVKIFATPINIHGGLQYSILTNAKYKYSGPLFGNETVVDTDNQSVNEWDFGLIGGVGINLTKVHIDLRMIRGTRKIEKDRTILTQTFLAKDTKHLSFQLTAGIAF